MSDDVTVLEDAIEAYSDGTVAQVRVLSVPTSEKFEEGIKYAYHYGEAGAEDPIIRFDNHHGVYELHMGLETFEIDYPGLAEIFHAWRAALPQRNEPTGDPKMLIDARSQLQPHPTIS